MDGESRLIAASDQSRDGMVHHVERMAGRTFWLLFFGCQMLAAQQSHHSDTASKVQQSAKISPNLQQADALRQQGLLDQAKAKVQDELQHNPDSIEAYNLLGFIYIGEKDYDNAVDAFQHALKFAPSSTKTHNNLGNVYVSQQKLDLAEKEFRTVLRLILRIAMQTTTSASC